MSCILVPADVVALPFTCLVIGISTFVAVRRVAIMTLPVDALYAAGRNAQRQDMSEEKMLRQGGGLAVWAESMNNVCPPLGCIITTDEIVCLDGQCFEEIVCCQRCNKECLKVRRWTSLDHAILRLACVMKNFSPESSTARPKLSLHRQPNSQTILIYLWLSNFVWV